MFGAPHPCNQNSIVKTSCTFCIPTGIRSIHTQRPSNIQVSCCFHVCINQCGDSSQTQLQKALPRARNKFLVNKYVALNTAGSPEPLVNGCNLAAAKAPGSTGSWYRLFEMHFACGFSAMVTLPGLLFIFGSQWCFADSRVRYGS